MKTISRLLMWALVLSGTCCLTASAQVVQQGFVAVTCYSDNNSNGPVVGLYDMRQAHLQTPNQNWSPPVTHGPATSPWTRANLGEVFGLCFDLSGNIYVSATRVYGNSLPSGGGNIYRIDANTGGITTFVTLTNNGNGLGNIAWDDVNNQMFATNFEDGKIYRISAAGVVLSSYDPFNPDGGGAKPAPLGERIWAIGVYNGRVYFSLWNENCNEPSNIKPNEIYSIALDPTGDFTGSEQLEISVPALPSEIHSNPVSDIAFSEDGNMLLAERTMYNSTTMTPNAHAARVLEYAFSAGSWNPTANQFSIGTANLYSGCGSYTNPTSGAAGGVDYAYGSYNSTTREIEDCDDAVWASGDGLHFGNPDFIYGFQRLPATGGDITNSVLVDADGNVAGGDKTHIGDIEVFKSCSTTVCPDIDITVDLLPSGDCCYELTFNSFSANSVASISANILTSNTIFSGVVGPTNWTSSNTGTSASWDSAGCIPSGVQNGILFCIQTQASAPQFIEIAFQLKDGTLCMDTIEVDCTPGTPSPCSEINDESIVCKEQGPKGWIYDYSFTITDYGPFSGTYPAENVTIYSITPGVSVSPTLVTFGSPLGTGAVSGTLNYTISGSGAQPGDQVCFIVQLHGARQGHGFHWSCPPDTVCVILPDCRDCCDSVDITVSDAAVRQIGNTAASVSSSMWVTPGPIMKLEANIMNVSRSRIWCPSTSTGTYTPVANPTSIAGLITGGSISPSMPVASGFNPATSEVIWGTVYSGVAMSGGQVNLNLGFPGTNLGWRCIDTLTVCVRYRVTDTAWVTCDTVVYYTIPRCGRIDIVVADDPIDVRPSFTPATAGSGYALDEPLYSEPVDGPVLSLAMSDYAQGTLAVRHWWQDVVVSGSAKIRLTKMYLRPEPGIDITGVAEEGGGSGEVSDRVAEIDIDLNERETDNFTVDFDNPSSAEYFSVRVYFDYVDLDDEDETLTSREYVVYGDLSGESAISIEEDENRATTLYKLLIDAQGTHSAGWVAPSCFRFTTPDGVRIVASGPMQNDITTDFHVLRPLDRDNAVLMPLPSGTDIRGTVIEKDDPLALWLVLEGSDDLVDLGWEALNTEGDPIAHGTLSLSTTSTVRDGDDAVPGAAIHLLEAWPNPSSERVSTRFNLYRSESVTVSVYDATGKEVSRVVNGQHLGAGWHEYDVNLSTLPDGVYYIRLKTENGTQTKSIVKQN